jgi:hypothetical protein
MLVHCFWLLDSNLGLNSEFVCSLFGLEKDLDLKKKKEKKKKNPNHRSSPACFPLQPSAAQLLAAASRRPLTLPCGAALSASPSPRLRRFRLGRAPESGSASVPPPWARVSVPRAASI